MSQLQRYQKEKDGSIVGPQAEHIKEVLRNGSDYTWCDKSVDGLCVLELWLDKSSSRFWSE